MRAGHESLADAMRRAMLDGFTFAEEAVIVAFASEESGIPDWLHGAYAWDGMVIWYTPELGPTGPIRSTYQPTGRWKR